MESATLETVSGRHRKPFIMSSDTSTPTEPLLAKPKLSYWRRLGGGSLAISLIVHGILLAIGVVWIIAVIPAEKEKIVDFAPSGGGGAPASNANQQKRSAMMKNISSRISAKGVSSNFTLPDPESSSNMSALGSLGGSMGGMGGSGGGIGAGKGPGTGLGTGIGMGTAAGSGNPFGMMDPNAGALVGTFYDFKQTTDRQPTNISIEDERLLVRDFTSGGWKEKDLAKYYHAKNKVYQTKVMIPLMSANLAPAAFNCEKEVEPSRWIVVYRGTVTPPKTGRYRFVGGADDILVVRFANKTVFDHGWTNGMKSDDRNYPMENPKKTYQYSTTPNYNKSIKGLGVGATFTAKAGTPYPIEILIGEVPGGNFCASLLVEENGEKYEKDPLEGAPILPLFRLDAVMPKVNSDDKEVPPMVPNSPIWKLIQNTGKPEF
jgi:hypothetical protein